METAQLSLREFREWAFIYFQDLQLVGLDLK